MRRRPRAARRPRLGERSDGLQKREPFLENPSSGGQLGMSDGQACGLPWVLQTLVDTAVPSAAVCSSLLWSGGGVRSKPLSLSSHRLQRLDSEARGTTMESHIPGPCPVWPNVSSWKRGGNFELEATFKTCLLYTC